MYKHNSNLITASAWMVGLSLLLFFLPAVNGLIGGAVGGYKAGTPGRGVMAALIPAAVIAIGLWVLMVMGGAPVWGLFAGTAVGILVIGSEVGLFIGAIVGGFIGQTRSRRLIV